MATRTANTGTNAWNTNGAWVGGVQPTAADDVVIPSSATVSVGNGVSVYCRSLTLQFGATVTLFNSTTSRIYIGDSVAGAGNVALSIDAGATLTATTAPNIHLVSTSATQQSLTTSGKTLPKVTINGAGSSYVLADAFTSSATITLTTGSLTSSGQTITAESVVAGGSLARTLDITGSHVILNATSGTPWNCATTNLTLTTTGSIIEVSSQSGSTRTFAGAGKSYGTLKYDVANSPGQLSITGSNSFELLQVGAGRTIGLASAVTQVISSWSGSGSPSGYISMGGETYGASIPDSAATSISGDIDIRVRMAATVWASSASKRICAKFLTTGNQRSWRLFNNNGTLNFTISTDGTNELNQAANQTLGAAGLVDDTPYWLRVTRQKSTGTVRFYYAPDSASMPSSWTQIGTNVTGGSTANIFDSTALNTVGGEQTGTNSAEGRYYFYQVRDNILDDGSGVQLEADFTQKPFGQNSFTESSANAATVTLNGSAVNGDGRLSMLGTSVGVAANIKKIAGALSIDYAVIKDIRSLTPYTFFAGSNSVDVSGNTSVVFATPLAAPLVYQSTTLTTVSASTTGSVTFPLTTTIGSLLVCVLGGPANLGTVTPPAGWSLGHSRLGTAHVLLFYKVADGSEATVAPSWTNSASPHLYALEITGFNGTPTLDSLIDSTSSSASSLATGSATNSTAPAIAIAAFSANGGMGVSSALPTNGFHEDYNSLQAAGSVLKWGVLPLTASAAQSTTFTWTTSRVPVSILINFIDAVAVSANTGSFFPFFE